MNDHQASSTPTEEDPIIVHIEQDFAPMIPRFMENRKKELVTMRHAMDQGDFETVRKLAHGMKGAGGSYGFDELTTAAAALEQAAKAASAHEVSTGLASIDSYLRRVDIVYE